MDINQSLEKGLVDKFGDRILFHCGNVTKYEDQAEAFKRTFEKWGQLDFGTFDLKSSGVVADVD